MVKVTKISNARKGNVRTGSLINSARARFNQDGSIRPNIWMRDHVRESSAKKMRTRAKREAQIDRKDAAEKRRRGEDEFRVALLSGLIV